MQAVNKLSSYVYNKSFTMFSTMIISQGAKHLTFAGGGWGVGMGDFRKKSPAHWFERKNILARKYLGKKYPALKKISLKADNLTMLYVGEKNSISGDLRKKVLNHGGSSINKIIIAWYLA